MSSSNTLQRLKDANLLKQYHSNLIFDYTEYPTKSFWKESFNYQEYEKTLVDWLKKTQKLQYYFIFRCLFLYAEKLNVYSYYTYATMKKIKL